MAKLSIKGSVHIEGNQDGFRHVEPPKLEIEYTETIAEQAAANPCPDCDGTGNWTCQACDGSGKDDNGDVCPQCMGDELVDCPACEGTGIYSGK